MARRYDSTFRFCVDETVEEFACYWGDGPRQDIAGPIAKLAVVKTSNLNEYILKRGLPHTLLDAILDAWTNDCGISAFPDDVFVTQWPSVIRLGCRTKRHKKQLPDPPRNSEWLYGSSARQRLMDARSHTDDAPDGTMDAGIAFWYTVHNDFFNGTI